VKNFDIIVWVNGRSTGDRFRNQSSDVVMNVTKAVNSGQAFSVSRSSDEFTVYGPGMVASVDVSVEKVGAY
jgi:hypothetical protein